jgi:hypothetical protein
MRNMLLSAVTVATLALGTAAPAFALCNPGTPHCVTDGGAGSRLNNAKHQVFDPGTFGNCDPAMGICSDEIASPSSRKAGTGTTGGPVAPTKGKVIVAPAIQ